MSNKNVTALIFAVLLLLSLALSVFANGNTKIDVTIPSEHTVMLVRGKGGKVSVGQDEYTGTNYLAVARHSTLSFVAVPASGYELDSVISNRAAEMTVQSDGAKIEKVCGDTVITVLFRAKAQSETPMSIDIPVTAKNESMAAGATLIGNKAIIDVDERKLDDLLMSESEGSSVSFDITKIDADVNAVVIPTVTVQKVAEQTASDDNHLTVMDVLLPQSTVTFDSVSLNAIAEQAQGDTITLRVQRIDTENLNQMQQSELTKLPDSTVIIEISLMSGNTYISDFNGGNTEITLPYTPQVGEDTETISVWFVALNGNMEQIPCLYENNIVRFTVNHFSNYLIKPGTITQEAYHCFICGWLGKNIAPWCLLIPILTAAIFCGIIVFVIRKYRIKY